MLISRLMGWMVNLCSRTGWTSVCTDWSTWEEVRGQRSREVMRGTRTRSLAGQGRERVPGLAAWGLICGSAGSGAPPWHHQGCRCERGF